MGKEIHLPIVSWATINRKDVFFTFVICLPILLSYFISYTYVCTILLILYEPVVLIFPTNILLSIILRKQPPTYLTSKNDIFPQSQLFEDIDNFRKIQSELLLINVVNEIPLTRDALPNQNYIGSESKWRLLPIRTVGKTHDTNAKKVPFLMSLLDKKECGDIVTVFYSHLEGGSHIPPHSGYFKGILRYHLGVLIPEPDKCTLTVHGQILHWKEGSGFLFDDMYLHSVNHTGVSNRSILWFDVIRPELNSFWRWWIKKLVVIATNSHWMQKANARTETVHKNVIIDASNNLDYKHKMS